MWNFRHVWVLLDLKPPAFVHIPSWVWKSADVFSLCWLISVKDENSYLCSLLVPFSPALIWNHINNLRFITSLFTIGGVDMSMESKLPNVVAAHVLLASNFKYFE